MEVSELLDQIVDFLCLVVACFILLLAIFNFDVDVNLDLNLCLSEVVFIVEDLGVMGWLGALECLQFVLVCDRFS